MQTHHIKHRILQLLHPHTQLSAWQILKKLEKKGYTINNKPIYKQALQHHLNTLRKNHLIEKKGTKYKLTEEFKQLVTSQGTLIIPVDHQLLFLNCPYYGKCKCEPTNLEKDCPLWQSVPKKMKKQILEQKPPLIRKTILPNQIKTNKTIKDNTT